VLALAGGRARAGPRRAVDALPARAPRHARSAAARAATARAPNGGTPRQRPRDERAPTTAGKAHPRHAGHRPPARRQRPQREAEPGRAAQAKAARQLQNAYADLMTPEELAAHRAKVKKTKTYAECKALFDATGKDMEARAKAQNKTVKATPTEICDKAKERGRLTG
jgi:leucyl aminopeptidase